MKLGSLFDGSGGFPLAGSLCGIQPVWAAEVEPYPIAVTRSRFPEMKHLGSVLGVNGGEIEPVDIITFGSPCQDLSVAGKRAGLKHESNGDGETTRSGLFMEAVRIIKEMRKATNDLYPRFIVWENVPGAFSSNNGQDFRTVLEEIIKIVEPSAVMPPVPKRGWAYADSYRGDGWSLSYRVLDAQYWGVPQRRKRIYLVADFAGGSAGKILFERSGLRGYFTQSKQTGQGATGNTESGVGATGFCGLVLNDQGGASINCEDGKVSTTLRAEAHGNEPALVYCLQGNGIDRADTAGCNGAGYKEGTSYTLNTIDRYTLNTIDRHAVSYENTYQKTNGPLMANSHPGSYSGQDAYTDMFVVGVVNSDAYTLDCRNGVVNDNISGTLQAKGNGGFSYNCINPVACDSNSYESNSMKSDNPHSGIYKADTSRTLDLNGGNPGCNQGGIAICQKVVGAVVFNEETVTSKTNAQNPQIGDACHTLGASGAGRALCCMEVDNTPTICMTTGTYTQTLKEQYPTLMARDYKDPPMVIAPHGQDSRWTIEQDSVSPTLQSAAGTGGGTYQ